MNATQPSKKPGMTLGDIYFVLFRHKRTILLCSLMGFYTAIAFYFVKRPPYRSEAKLFIRYVLDNRSKSSPDSDSKVMSPDERGDNIINSEVEILTSLDLAQKVADTIGPAKILAKLGGGNDPIKAAKAVQKSLLVEPPRKSSVIRLAFQHPDSKIVQPVLGLIIDNYLKRHAEVHREVGMSEDFLIQETERLRARLSQTEDELSKAYRKAGVISVDDAKKAYTEQLSKIHEELFNAEAELAEQNAIRELTTKAPEKTEAAAETSIGSARINDYLALVTRLDLLRKREQELLTQFTGENKLVRVVRQQIAQTETEKKGMEAASPGLVTLDLVARSRGGNPTNDPLTDFTRSAALQARIKVLNAQLEQVRTAMLNLSEMDMTIEDLQRKKALEEANYRTFSASLEQSRIDEALGSGRIANISKIQAPSPPFRDWSKFLKLAAGLGFGGIFIGLGYSFLVELYLDRSVKRPIEVETRLNVPLLLSIPDVQWNGHRRFARLTRKQRLLLKNGSASSEVVTEAGTENGALVTGAKSKENGALQPFYEALRDRLLTHFETRNLTHTPKLIAVTGLDKNAGVSTIASGLAACLSETGDGDILLVDMNPGHASALEFQRNGDVLGLENALDGRDDVQVQDRLFVVGEGTERNRSPRILHMMPKLRASNYDFIIFDMPPINQTSITPRLAAFMDTVMLVVESEKTNMDTAVQAVALLPGQSANTVAVLNKVRNYVPTRLHQEFLSLS